MVVGSPELVVGSQKSVVISNNFQLKMMEEDLPGRQPDNLYRSQLLITGNQFNLICNSPIELKTSVNMFLPFWDLVVSQHASPVEPELGTAETQLVSSLLLLMANYVG